MIKISREKVCVLCKKNYLCNLRGPAFLKQLYCSRACFWEVNRQKPRINNRNENNYLWKGNGASYSAKHKWMISHFGYPEKCEFCKKDKLKGHQIHWANISGEYKRIKEDWLRLCASCHKIFDQKNIYA